MTTYLVLEIPQASTFRFVINVVDGPDDLTDYTGRMQIRESRVGTLLAELDPDDIVVNHITRQVVVTIPSEVTATFDWEKGLYDLYIDGPDEDAWRLVEGSATVSRSVTRED